MGHKLQRVTFASGNTFSNTNNLPTGSVTISGTAIVGNTLTAVTSKISDDNGLGDFSYQWFQDGLEIVGATSKTFIVTQDEVGGDLSVVANYVDGAGNFESLTSLTIYNVGIAFDPDLTETFTIPVLHFINNDGTGEDVVQFYCEFVRPIRTIRQPCF